MCARCEQLEEEVAYLRSELGLAHAAEHVGKLCSFMCLTPQQARMVLALYRSKGVLSVAQLEDACPPSKTDERVVGCKLVDVRVHQLRRRFGHDFIETVWGLGRRLSERGRAQVASVLAPTAEAA